MDTQTNNNFQGVAPLSPVNKLRKMLPFIVVAVVILAGAIVGAVALLRSRTGPNGGPDGTGDGIAELTYWGWSVDQQVMDDLIADFENQNPDIKVTYEKKAHDDYHKILKTRLLSGDSAVTPDVFESNNEFINDVFDALAHNTEISIPDVNQRFFPGASEVCVQGGMVVCYPLNFDGLVLIYNQEALNQAGQETIPDEWTDFRAWANALTDKRLVEIDGNEQWVVFSPGAAIGTGANVSHGDMLLWLMMMQNGVSLDSPGELEGMLSTEGVVAAELYISYYEDRVWDKSFSSDISAFLAGNVPVMFGTVADVETILEADPAFSVLTVPPPQIGGVKNLAHFQTMAVANSSPEQAAAWKWADYLTSSDAQQQLLESGLGGETGVSLPSRRDLQLDISRVPGMKSFEAIFLTSYPIFLPEYETASADTISAIEAMILDESPLDPETALEELVEGLQSL